MSYNPLKNLIQNVYIYDVKERKEIGSYSPINLKKELIEKEIKLIISQQQKSRVGEYFKGNNSSSMKNLTNFFKETKNNIIYIVTVLFNIKSYDYDSIYDFIDEIDSQKIYQYSKAGELSNVAKQNLQYLIDKYQEANTTNSGSNRLSEVKSEINNATLQMKDNLKNVVNNLDNVKSLDSKANKIRDTSLLFKRDSENLKNKAKCRNLKLKIAIGIAISVILIYLIYSFTS